MDSPLLKNESLHEKAESKVIDFGTAWYCPEGTSSICSSCESADRANRNFDAPKVS